VGRTLRHPQPLLTSLNLRPLAGADRVVAGQATAAGRLIVSMAETEILWLAATINFVSITPARGRPDGTLSLASGSYEK
jgi:hypothetical protein